MSWQEQLQAASFRGVPFVVEADDGGFGRRGELHQYPQRDKPYFEDLGRKARERNFTAFVIGADFMAARDRLLAAIETSGAGELVHPWYGRMTVSIIDCRVSHDIKEGGMCRFQLSFIENGDLSFPSINIAPGAQSLLAADELQVAAIQDFTDNFNVNNLPAFALDDAVLFANTILDTLSTNIGNLSTVLNDPLAVLKTQLSSLLVNPSAFATQFFDIYSKGNSIIGALAGLQDTDAINFLRAFSTLNIANSFNQSASNVSTPTRTQISANQVALNALARRSLLVQVAGMTAAMPLPVYDDANALRVALLAELDNEATTANDAIYLAVNNLRSKVFSDMNSRIQGAAKLQEIKPIGVQPALVLAYDLYENVTRENEILSRNKIQHPGFIPTDPLKVLSA